MAFFGVRLSDDLAVRFDAFASSRGGRSKLLRQMIETVLRSGGGAPPAAEAELRARGRSEKVTIRLRDEDLTALDAACRQAGLRRTEWVVGLVRRRLLGRPQFSRAEAQALLEIRRDLRRIGVNLNQAVHALHSRGGGRRAPRSSWPSARRCARSSKASAPRSRATCPIGAERTDEPARPSPRLR